MFYPDGLELSLFVIRSTRSEADWKDYQLFPSRFHHQLFVRGAPPEPRALASSHARARRHGGPPPRRRHPELGLDPDHDRDVPRRRRSSQLREVVKVRRQGGSEGAPRGAGGDTRGARAKQRRVHPVPRVQAAPALLLPRGARRGARPSSISSSPRRSRRASDRSSATDRIVSLRAQP
eukprot:31090-Pelagococcus_subviridis.AAC.13